MKPLNEMHELPVYGTDRRVKVKTLRGPWQEVELRVHSLEEIDHQHFWSFLEQAVAGFKKITERVQQDPESIMPWTVLGRKWHLLRKGFPPGKRIALGSRSAGRTARNVVGRRAEGANAVES